MWMLTFKQYEIKNAELLNLTLENFGPLATREIEILFEKTTNMLRRLDSNSQTFDNEYNQIVLGTMILSCEIDRRKYGQQDKATYNVIQVLKNLYDDAATENFIKTVGQKALDHEISFDPHIIDWFPRFVKAVPFIKERLIKSITAVKADERHKKFIENGPR